MGSSRPRPSLEFELRSGHPAHLVAGVDEVGRGCLAGPVVAAAVILPAGLDLTDENWSSVTDSKLLTQNRREELDRFIRSASRAFAIGVATVDEILSLNILRASHLAMIRAVAGLSDRPDHVLVDGNALPRGLGVPATPIVKGDQRSIAVAAASILAKVHRDQLMEELDRIYPGYGFAENKGYGVPVHLKGLHEKGPCAIHRTGFAPVRKLLGGGPSQDAPE